MNKLARENKVKHFGEHGHDGVFKLRAGDENHFTSLKPDFGKSEMIPESVETDFRAKSANQVYK